MSTSDWITERFEAHRRHLHAVALRMLGSPSEADDAVQEAWIRLNRVDSNQIDNLGGWLTTVVARISLDLLRSRASRKEEPADIEAAAIVSDTDDPGDRAIMADAVGSALIVVLDTLAPDETGLCPP